jgi:NADH dehydrogenase FAD-containing subunit
MKPQPTSVVVLGAGYAGLLFTARLAGKTSSRRVQITLVNESDTFTERLRLQQFATNQPIRWRSIAKMLRGTDVRFVQGTVTELLPDQQEVVLDHQGNVRHLRYDYLAYALGSLTDRGRVPGVGQYAYTLAPRGPLSAAALREVLPAEYSRGGRVVVCGGGATGIETAAELARSYPGLDVRLVTQGALALFLGTGVARYIRRSLERLGVGIADHITVAEVQADRVLTSEGEAIPCDLCIWTGGFVAAALAREAGLRVNERGQVLVDPFMRSLSHPAIYAVGDAAYPAEEPGVAVRMSAFTATILGAHGADCLSAILRGRSPRPLSFAYLGQGVALGRGNAIGFNNYPDDRPHRPYFTGRLGYQTRELFVRFLAASPAVERRWPGFFFWVGKRRYARMRRRQCGQGAHQVKAGVSAHQG